MKNRMFALTLGVIAFASPAFAQVGTGGTITDGNASFTLNDYLGDAFGNGATSNFTVGGPGNPDHVYQSWWWYRGTGANGDREFSLSNGTNASWSGNVGRIDYTLEGKGTARALFVVQGLEDGYGSLTTSLIFRNTTSETVTLDFFNYLDADLDGSAGGDSADLIGDNVIRIIDGDWIATYEGTDIYSVGDFSDIRDELTDDNADDFASTGLPFSTGDFTGGFQWHVTVAPGRAVTLTSSVTITAIPAPGALTLFGAGLGMLGFRRRR